MTMPRVPILLAACAAFALAPAPAHAQTPAARPLRIVVAAAPASPADDQIRALLPALTEALGRVLIIDNRGSAHGIPAGQTVARAEPNGATLLLGSSVTHAANPALHERLPYDPVRDFAPVTQLASTGMIVVGHPRLPGHAMGDLTSHAKAEPAPLKLGSHEDVVRAAGAALARHLGFRTQAVMHQASLPAMRALTSGAVDWSLLTPYAARPHVHGGRLKAYGITGNERSSALPEVATLAEQGIEGYELPSWDGLFAPAGTSADSVHAVQRGTVQALQAPTVRRLYLELGITPVGSTPAEFAAILARDIAVFRRIASAK